MIIECDGGDKNRGGTGRGNIRNPNGVSAGGHQCETGSTGSGGRGDGKEIGLLVPMEATVLAGAAGNGMGSG